MSQIRPKVLLYEKMHSVGTALLEKKCDVIYAESLDEAYLLKKTREVDAVIIRANGAVTKDMIVDNPKLKVIGRHGVGLDAIDLAAAKSSGVVVVNTPVANSESVAEHFLVLALMLAKKVRQADIALRQGRWDARYELIGTELKGKTIGVVGFGKIGQQVARICHNGLEMQVLYDDVVRQEQMEADIGAQKVDRETLFTKADAVSLNLPLLSATRHVINASLLGLMKPTAIIINMARGPVWLESDVVNALATGQIAGAGADVYEQEPVEIDNPLFQFDNFVGTPHMSAHTDEAMIKMSLVAEDVLAVLEGRTPKYPVLV
jgi:D-3-phosphoglycerate dehydrogenase / 2-oxoglutarate reductase